MTTQLRTFDEAKRDGKVNEDYFPREACSVCGAVLYWNGVRYATDHDRVKHGATDGGAERRATNDADRGIASAVSRAAELARAGVRRATGERDDD